MDKSKAYEILGLGSAATEEDVKKAYKELAQKYNVDNYEAGPLRQEAEEKMNDINQAFDVVMSYLRTGTVPSQDMPMGGGSHNTGRYASIRQMITNGQYDEALAELSAIPNGSADAEWNFLMGSVYYYKGWLDRAFAFFQQAVRLEPSNREYAAALRNLQSSSEGDMKGSPYPSDAQALQCACNTCTMMLCMDACCGMCRAC